MPAGVVTTLAYVFWHQPAAPDDRAGYEERLTAFHQALATRRGGRRSASYRVERVPWVPDGTAYEDWYEVSGWDDLSRLAELAVSGQARAPHDDAAARAGWGSAGVYALRSGDGFAGAHATWADKPADVDSEQLFAPAGERDGQTSAWLRQIALGPAPELCLLGDRPASLGLEEIAVVRDLVCST